MREKSAHELNLLLTGTVMPSECVPAEGDSEGGPQQHSEESGEDVERRPGELIVHA